MIQSSAVAAASRHSALRPTPAQRRLDARIRAMPTWLLLLSLLLGAELAAQECAQWRAVFESVEGAVELRATEQSAWQPARPGTVACDGALVRVGSFGRATLRLPDNSLLKLDRNTSLRLTALRDNGGSLIDIVFGIIHVISRDPRFLRFNTPYVNAGLEGTEFDIEVREDDTIVTVIEGEVRLSNASGELYVPSGQRGSARSAEAPRLAPVEDRFERANWTLYFVPLLDRALPEPDAEAGASIDAGFYVERAAARLRVGRPDAAHDDIARALMLDAGRGDALALRALIELVHGQRGRAAASAARAVELDPTAAAPLLARSYVEQAQLDREAAARSAQRAVTLAPDNAIAWARLAELRLENGEFFAGLGAATRALELQPSLGPARTVLGFALLMQTDVVQAEAAFRRAIADDDASPLPRLGLGLALIRQGRLEDGREEIEIAVILDPQNALTRSYMARVYAGEQRLALTDTQLELARMLAPEDPTPYFYTTLSRQAQNRPVEALQAFRTATALNGNRPLYRSTLGLDEDLAARSAGIGPLHRALGFEQLAINSGLQSILADPSDHSGHRLLADVYSTLPRHQIARVNELFLSQLLQPTNVSPIQAQLAEPNLFILDEAGPSDLAFSEFGRVLSRNGLLWQLSGVGGSNGTRGTDFTVAGLEDRLSYSAGYFSFQSDGVRPNNDVDQRIVNAFAQYRLSPTLSLQGELRSNRTERGDLALRFDRDAYNATQRQTDRVDTARLGVRQDLAGNSTLLGSVVYEQSRQDVEFPPFSRAIGKLTSYSVDVRHIFSARRWLLNSGVQAFRRQEDEAQFLTPPIVADLVELGAVETSTDWTSIYAYLDYALTSRITASFGASAEHISSESDDIGQINPKLALTWKPGPRTDVHVASFRTLQGPLASQHGIHPRLEPTHVGHFNQYFFGSEGEQAWRHALGVDHEISSAMFAGIEVSTRAIDRMSTALFPDGSAVTLEQDIDETFLRSYLYWAPQSTWSFSAEYQLERIDGNGMPVPEGYTDIRTRRLPIELNLFHRNALSSRLEATYVHQSGNFSPMMFGPADIATAGEDNFWIYDFALIYRLPARHGSLSLNVDNIFDESFRFQDLDPQNPSILPERMISLRFSLSY